eukprot:1136779-Pelagomonas_calceolata.AAC.3
MLAVKLCVQCLLSDLVEYRKAISGDVRVALENSSCYCGQFSPYNGIGNTCSVWLDIAGPVLFRVVGYGILIVEDINALCQTPVG